ncbi:MAG: hypothetical protein IK000_09290 [Bacteroidaceae bacterium]|nr:hypothetical protein [Bacteroidaceae bacterium]
MKRNFLLLCLCLAFAGVGMAQTGSEDENQLTEERVDTISIQKKGLGYSYTMGSRMLTGNNIASILKSNEKAYKMYKGAYWISYLSYPFAYAGGGLLGYEVADILLGKQLDTKRLAIGGACLVTAIGISSIAEWKLKKSVEKYNEGLLNPAPSPSSDDVAINFGITPSGGLGFTLTF